MQRWLRFPRNVTPPPEVAWNGPFNNLLGLLLALVGVWLVIRLPLGAGVMLIGGVAILVGTLIEPLVGLTVALFLGPLKGHLSAEVPQVPAQIAHLFVALALTSWLADGISRRELRIRPSPVLLALLGFFGAGLLSLWQAADPATYGPLELLKWAEIILLVIFIDNHLSETRMPWLIGALLLPAIFQAGVGIWQFGFWEEGPEHFAILGGDFYRAHGTFEQPNPFAGYLGMMIPLALGCWWGAVTAWWESGRMRQRILRYGLPLLFYSAAAGIMVTALGMSWSRGAWLGFATAAAALIAALPRKIGWRLLLVAVLVTSGGGLYISNRLPAAITTRLTSFVKDLHLGDVRGTPINDANYAVIERLAHWQSALEMFRRHFWTGVGLGCYEPAYPAFALINWPTALGHAHNVYLNMAAETGLIGLVVYLVLWIVIFWQTWRLTRRAQGFPRGIAIGLLGAWVHLSVHHMLDNLYVNNVHLHIGVMLGLLAFIADRPDASLNRPTSQAQY